MQESLVKSIVEAANVVIWEAKLPELAFSYVSPYAECMFGYPTANWAEPGFWESILHPEDREATLKFCNEQTAANKDHELDYRARKADGSYIWVRDIVSVSSGTDGGTVLRGAFIDITNQKMLERNLHEAREKAEEAEWAKSRLMTRMAHDLRTPLNGIVGAMQILQAGQRATDELTALATIDACSNALMELIDDTFAMADIPEERIASRPDWTDLPELFEGACAVIGPQARSRGLAFDAEIAPSAAVYAWVDRGALRRVLYNLLSNAVKFTARGRVGLSARIKDGMVSIEVRDTGRGMAAGMAATLNRPLSNAGSVRVSHDGHGLGLSIVRQLVEMMDGTLEFGPHEGAGTVARLTLPLDTRPLKRSGGRSQTRLKALYAEDNVTNAQVMSELLKLQDIEIDIALNGRDAVKRFQEGEYDLVLMDLRMPVMSGLEATRQIRSYEAETVRGRAPIIGVTAHSQAEDVQDCLAAGMDAHLPKPVRLEQLMSLVNDLVIAPRGA